MANKCLTKGLWLWALSGLVITACEAESNPSVRVQYRVPGQLPFPNDLFTQPDPSTVTGQHLAIERNSTAFVTGAYDLQFFPEPDLTDWVNGMDGFSLFPNILVGLTGPVDPSSLPDTAAASTESSSSVLLYDLFSCDGPIPVQVTHQAFEVPRQPMAYVLQVKPDLPLHPATRYGLVVTDGVRAVDGTPIGSSPEFRAVVDPDDDVVGTGDSARALREARDRTAPLLACLGRRAPLLRADDLVAATVFTTSAATRMVSSVFDFLRTEAAPPLEMRLDLDEDGQPDLYPSTELPNLPDDVSDLSNVGWVLKGAFDAPDFRGEDGDIHLARGETPTVTAIRRAKFVLALPADAGQQPYPLVILQHGHTASKENMMYVANYLCGAGLAVAGIDAVGHGEMEGPGNYLDFMHYVSVRGSFLQTEVNLFRFFVALQSLDELDLMPAGAGDGTFDLKLDGPVGFVGESLGGITGSVLVALEPRVAVAVLNVTTGGLGLEAQRFFDALFSPDDLYDFVQFQGLLQGIADPMDPLSYAERMRGDAAQGDLQVLMQSVAGDVMTSPVGTEVLARSIGVPYVCPCPAAVTMSSLPRVDAPTTSRGLFYYDSAKHGFLLSNNGYPDASHAVRTQATHFLSTFFAGQPAEIIDPFVEE